MPSWRRRRSTADPLRPRRSRPAARRSALVWPAPASSSPARMARSTPTSAAAPGTAPPGTAATAAPTIRAVILSRSDTRSGPARFASRTAPARAWLIAPRAGGVSLPMTLQVRPFPAELAAVVSGWATTEEEVLQRRLRTSQPRPNHHLEHRPALYLPLANPAARLLTTRPHPSRRPLRVPPHDPFRRRASFVWYQVVPKTMDGCGESDFPFVGPHFPSVSVTYHPFPCHITVIPGRITRVT